MEDVGDDGTPPAPTMTSTSRFRNVGILHGEFDLCRKSLQTLAYHMRILLRCPGARAVLSDCCKFDTTNACRYPSNHNMLLFL
ncbi:hypothetical protein HBI04_164290 [Parastagonospora nodorum]|nr:hypothetical protein HBI04_164290 [Parastagonospora nodorum]KAH4332075.1 hypothetical protein HBI00_069700 [Parastagonospora nodorum]KAH4373068.1 hypothetical protein HBH94_113140 [Parastagonospora nodorum]KAH4829340.1 hypothetical protein HBH60_098480 [Parastagonospora nodorum]KAH5232147.1 hypothetical protein HBI62_068180 [Parastagonospora nodorum]